MHDGFVEQAFCGRHAEQVADFAAAAGFAKDRDVVWIAAERSDVVAHPLECKHQIEHAGIAGVCQLLTAEFSEVQITEGIQTMIHRDDDDIAAST